MFLIFYSILKKIIGKLRKAKKKKKNLPFFWNYFARLQFPYKMVFQLSGGNPGHRDTQ